MTKESQSILTKIKELIDELEVSVLTGVSEDMSPNDPCYDSTVEERMTTAQEKLEELVMYFSL